MTLRSWKHMNVGVLAPTFTHPQDYGNRKRLFSFCDALSRAGADIHLLHYAAELNWRSSIDTEALREASQRWTGVFTIPPTRPSHSPPKGTHHELDEWWDPIIGEYVAWAERTCSLDVLIVMYPYLSKAFEHISGRVYRILDMNDRFSGRKELLQENGLKPEFFYTTEAEELKALQRADLVWAIKEEEAVFFRSLGAPSVLALPHVDELSPIEQSERSEVLRAGFIGAPNTINVRNITNFLNRSLPVFREYLPPLEIVVGGNISSLLKLNNTPYLRVSGPVKSVKSFYEQIDVAIIPMTFSTGLKIKTTEALSFGVPVVAHAHAFEGLPAQHPYHRLGSHEEIAQALVELAFAPELLEALRAASRRAAGQLREDTEAALDRTRALIQSAKEATLYVGSAAGMEIGSFAYECLASRLVYLAKRAPLFVCLEGEADGSVIYQLAQRLAAARFVLDGASDDAYRIGRTNVFPSGSAAEILDQCSVREVVLERLPAEGERIHRPEIGKIVVLADELRISSPEDRKRSREHAMELAKSGAFIVVGTAPGDIASDLADIGPDVTFAACPPFWFKELRPMRELAGRTMASNDTLCLIAEEFDERTESLCKALSSAYGFRSIRVFGFEVRAPIPLLSVRIHFVDVRKGPVLPEAAAARAIVAIHNGSNTILAGLGLALELLGRSVAKLQSGEPESWMSQLADCADVSGARGHFPLRGLTDIGQVADRSGWWQILPPHGVSLAGGSGLSEVIYNKARAELFVRGYAFDADGAVEPVITTHNGETHEAYRWKVLRRELKTATDQRCGWEFFLPDFTPQQLRSRLEITSRGGIAPHLSIGLLPKAKAKTISIDISIDALVVDTARRKLLVRGTIFGNRDSVARITVSLEKIPLAHSIFTPDKTRSGEPRTPFEVEASLSATIQGLPYQVFASAGKNVELSAVLKSSASYAINTARALAATDFHETESALEPPALVGVS